MLSLKTYSTHAHSWSHERICPWVLGHNGSNYRSSTILSDTASAKQHSMSSGSMPEADSTSTNPAALFEAAALSMAPQVQNHLMTMTNGGWGAAETTEDDEEDSKSLLPPQQPPQQQLTLHSASERGEKRLKGKDCQGNVTPFQHQIHIFVCILGPITV